MELTANITKLDEDERRFFGFAYVVTKDGTQVQDHSGDVIDDPESRRMLEDAVYRYVQEYGSGDHDHAEFGAATLIESVVLTKEKAELMGIDTPVEGVWMGFQAHRDEAGDRLWQAVKSGKGALSIVGSGRREAIA